jgi:hypothetical protein
LPPWSIAESDATAVGCGPPTPGAPPTRGQSKATAAWVPKSGTGTVARQAAIILALAFGSAWFPQLVRR